jgi:hypothetical protein
MAEYEIYNVVKIGLALAQSRRPPLQQSAIREFGDMLSAQVQRGDWVQVGEEVLTASGETPQDVLELTLSTRPHWLIPPEVVEKSDQTWTTGGPEGLRLRGERWKELRAVMRTDALATAALAEEGKCYGLTATEIASTKAGHAPGSKPSDEEVAGLKGLNNPYSRNWQKGDEAARQEAINELIRRLGTKAAAGIAASAGRTIDGRPLRK